MRDETVILGLDKLPHFSAGLEAYASVQGSIHPEERPERISTHPWLNMSSCTHTEETWEVASKSQRRPVSCVNFECVPKPHTDPWVNGVESLLAQGV